MAVDYENDKGLLRTFLTTFHESLPNHRGKHFKYAKQITDVANRKEVTVIVDLDDLEMSNNDDLVERIEANTKRYTKLLSECIAELLPEYKTTHGAVTIDSLDVYIEHRLAVARQRILELQETQGNTPPGSFDVAAQFPPELLQRFEAYWKPRSSIKAISIRSLKSDQIGKLVSIHGVVIRASEVRPLLSVATYTCDTCSAETFQTMASPSFIPLVSCTSEFCKTNKAGGRLQLQTRGSKFVKFQELKIQEQSSSVPAGHVPRAISIYCRGENTRLATAGDHVSISGIFLPMPKMTAFAQINQGLIAETYMEAHRVSSISKWDDGEVIEELTSEELKLMTQPDFYEKLAASIAPEVYGHEDVKKSLLLQLVGGVERNVGGLKIRGTINICLMGDPGVAKSQLLSYVDRLAPRSQLTSGRGSTGVGLTASIMKDSVTGLMTLEAGALMLADQGVCAIDEFDKMNEFDRTSLHEVMEQQTISICKAGILTTLHARTSVLAAANPAYGRYNPHRSVQDNVNLPAALLSRFDLLWLMQDRPDQQEDLRLAKHITYVHQHLAEPPSSIKPMDMALMRKYIQACKHVNPVIPPELSESLVAAYVELRNEARNSKDTTFTSPRSLLAILRFSTALARLRMAQVVTSNDVNEAIRLVERARESVKVGSVRHMHRSVPVTEQIAQIIRKLKTSLPPEVTSIQIKDIRSRTSAAGFTNEQLQHCIDEYEAVNLWQLNHARTTLTFV